MLHLSRLSHLSHLPRRAPRRRPVAVAALTSAALLAGCGAGGAGTAGAAGADASTGRTSDGTLDRTSDRAADDVVTVVGPFEVHSLDPATAGGVFSRLEVTETLVEADDSGALQPGLATAWSASPDGLAWTFELREGAMFHDGTPVTAEAVATSVEVAATKEGTPLTSVPLVGVRPGTPGDGAGGTDATGGTVVVELERPFEPLPAVLAHTSTQVLAPVSYGEGGAVEQVVGSGPYQVDVVEQPSRVTASLSPHWDGAAPEVQRVEYQAVGRAESRALMAESGQADVTFGMDPTSLERLQGAPGLTIVSETLPRTIQLTLNADDPALADVRVRQALSLALDREAMATALLRDPEMAATQLFPPTVADWHDEDVEPLRHDQDAARDLLADAGWTEGADGVLERDGRPLRLQLRTFPDRPELPVLATAIQAAWAEVGVDLDVAVGNSSEIPAARQDGTLQVALYARNFALVPDPLVTLLGDFGPEGADFGAVGWQDPAVVDTLAALAAGEVEDEAAARTSVVATLQEELPVVPVAWYRQSVVVGDQVEGVDLDPLERSLRLSRVTWAR